MLDESASDEATSYYIEKPSTLSEFSDSIIQCQIFHGEGMSGLNEFASPGYPNKYPPSIDCVRVIFAPPGYDILLKFRNVFQIETSYTENDDTPAMGENCPNDFLEIRDGRYSFSPLIGKFCGMSKPRMEIRATSGFMWLQFHSDALLEFEGFFGEFEYVRSLNGSQERQTECYFSYTMALDGFINITTMQEFYESHRIPPSPLDCVWRIQVPSHLNIAVFFEDFLLPSPNYCQENFIELYAGSTSHIPLQKFCGVTTNHVYTGKNVVFARVFTSGLRVLEQMKLSLLFSAYVAQKNCSEPNLFACGDDICIPSSLVCNGRANCLYKRDEDSCSTSTYTFTSIITSSYVPLPFIVFVVVAAVVVLFLVYKPYKKIPRERVVDFLRRLSTEIYQTSHSCRSSVHDPNGPSYPPINTSHIKNSISHTRPTLPNSSSLTWSDVHHMYCPNRPLNEVHLEPSTSGANGSCVSGHDAVKSKKKSKKDKPVSYRTKKPRTWSVSAVWLERELDDHVDMVEMVDMSGVDGDMEANYTNDMITSVTV